MASKWLTVGTVRASKKDPSKSYIQISEDVTFRAGTILQVSDPREKYDRMVAKGAMTEEEAEERKQSVPDYIRFEIVLPPKDNR